MADKVALAVFMRALNCAGNLLAERLTQGDAFNRFIGEKLQSNVEKMKNDLQAIKEKDLYAGIDRYEQGVSLVKFHKSTDEVDSDAGVSPARLIKANVTDSAKRLFNEARQLTNNAVNANLKTADRIVAMKFLVNSTLLGADDTTEALTLCKGFLEKVHSWEDVKSDFETEVTKSFRRKDLRRRERRKIISSVCELNRIVFDVVQMAGGEEHRQKFFVWPCIEIKTGQVKEKIDPLRDSRLREALREESKDNEHEDSSVVWSFGNREAYEDHNLHHPHSIATNSQGQFIVVETATTKVFDRRGNYRYALKIPNQDVGGARYGIVDVDTDKDAKVYLLVEVTADEKPKQQHCYKVAVFDKQGSHIKTFSLNSESTGRKLAVNSYPTEAEVLVLEGPRGYHARVELYKTEGSFLGTFGGRILEDAQDIDAANDGRIFVLDKSHHSGHKFVREFSADERSPLRRFDVDADSVALTFDSVSEHVVIISASFVKNVYCEKVSIYSLSRNDYQRPVHFMELDEKCEVVSIPNQNVVVTATGRIAIVLERVNTFVCEEEKTRMFGRVFVV